MIPELWEILENYATERGAASTRETCRRWMLKKTLAGILPEKRKAIPPRWIGKAYLRQKGKCARCGNDLKLTEAVGDHRKPIALGGSHAGLNIDACHAKCNSAKGARSLSEDAKRTGTNVREYLERAGVNESTEEIG